METSPPQDSPSQGLESSQLPLARTPGTKNDFFVLLCGKYFFKSGVIQTLTTYPPGEKHETVIEKYT